MALGGGRQLAGESPTGGGRERRLRPAPWAVNLGAGLAGGAPAAGLAALHLPPMICLAVMLAGPPLAILASAVAYSIMRAADRKTECSAQEGYQKGLKLVASLSGVTLHMGVDGVDFQSAAPAAQPGGEQSAAPAAEPGGQQLRGVS